MDVVVVRVLSGVARRSAPSICNFSSACVRRDVNVCSVPCPAFFSSGPCGP